MTPILLMRGGITLAPLTPILDPFDSGPNQSLRTRAGWHPNNIWNGDADFATDSVPTYAAAGAVNCDAAWGTSFAANQEFWFTLGSVVNSFDVYFRQVEVDINGPTYAGYAINYDHPSQHWQFWNKLFTTTIGPSVAQPLAAGDSVLIRMTGTTMLAAYRPGSGAWAPVVSTTDSVVTAGGYVGFDSAPNARFDLVGGGSLP